MSRSMGTGMAILDFDGDGRLDLYFLQNGGPGSGAKNELWRQEKDGRFQDVSKGSGLDVEGFGMGSAVGDIDNDGRVDMAVTEYGNIRLFHNEGEGRFREVTDEAGLHRVLWGMSCAFLDYDRDGRLDFVSVNYVEDDPTRPCSDYAGKRDFCGPQDFLGNVTKLYHNETAPGGPIRFVDVTGVSGLGKIVGPGLGVSCLDFDGDGWVDILVANDGKPNHLWINQRDGRFQDEGVLRGLAYDGLGRSQAGMGIALGDVAGRGNLGIFMTHLSEETNCFWSRLADKSAFVDETASMRLANPRWRATGFGTVLGDMDLDGDLDLAIVNGRVRRGAVDATLGGTGAGLDPFWHPYAERSQLFENGGEGVFTDVSENNTAFSGEARVARALAMGDLDNDGDLDLVSTAIGSPARVYRNVAPRRGRWLSVRAVDPATKRDAHDGQVTVRAAGRAWIRWLNPAYSYLCSNDPRVHFGLGRVERVDEIELEWPDGTRELFRGSEVDRAIVVEKGQGRAVSSPNP
jgi:hypothetical protein